MAIKLYRKRLIPEECIYLKDDKIIYQEDARIVTTWNTIRERPDFSHGISCYFIDKGFKISKFYTKENTLLYWYCDIIETTFTKETETYLFTDLLADVIIYPDGFVKVVDLDEIAEALDDGALTNELLKKSLVRLNNLLSDIYSKEFSKYSDFVESFEN